MMRVFLSTTALVAAGLLVTSVAYADEEEMMAEEEMMEAPVSVGVGGYYRAALGGYDADGATNDRGHLINQNIEINVFGETTLDNGLTAGVNVWLDGNIGIQDDTSETRVYISGGFGQITVGQFESAAQLGTVWSPGGNANFGVNSQFFSPGGGTSWQGIIGANEDDVTVMYASPVFNGLSFSASYAPEDAKTSYAGQSNNDAGEISETIAASLNGSVDMMGGSVTGGIGYETGTPEVCAGMCDATSLRGGLVVSIDEISVGGYILEIDNQGATTTHSDVGIGWSQAGLNLGLQYGNVDAASGDSDITAFNAAYALGPGIEMNSQIAVGSSGGSDWTQFLIGTAIFF